MNHLSPQPILAPSAPPNILPILAESPWPGPCGDEFAPTGLAAPDQPFQGNTPRRVQPVNPVASWLPAPPSGTIRRQATVNLVR